MIRREYWLKRIEDAWSRRSVVWLSGVRRVGKTTLVKMWPDVVYMNCDLPSVVRSLEYPESVRVFRSLYPKGDNYVVSPAVIKPYKIRRGELVFSVCKSVKL